jgi:hypothetical protein
MGEGGRPTSSSCSTGRASPAPAQDGAELTARPRCRRFGMALAVTVVGSSTGSSTVISSTEHASVGIISCKPFLTSGSGAHDTTWTSEGLCGSECPLERTAPVHGLRILSTEACFGSGTMDLTADL